MQEQIKKQILIDHLNGASNGLSVAAFISQFNQYLLNEKNWLESAFEILALAFKQPANKENRVDELGLLTAIKMNAKKAAAIPKAEGVGEEKVGGSMLTTTLSDIVEGIMSYQQNYSKRTYTIDFCASYLDIVIKAASDLGIGKEQSGKIILDKLMQPGKESDLCDFLQEEQVGLGPLLKSILSGFPILLTSETYLRDGEPEVSSAILGSIASFSPQFNPESGSIFSETAVMAACLEQQNLMSPLAKLIVQIELGVVVNKIFVAAQLEEVVSRSADKSVERIVSYFCTKYPACVTRKVLELALKKPGRGANAHKILEAMVCAIISQEDGVQTIVSALSDPVVDEKADGNQVNKENLIRVLGAVGKNAVDCDKILGRLIIDKTLSVTDLDALLALALAANQNIVALALIRQLQPSYTDLMPSISDVSNYPAETKPLSDHLFEVFHIEASGIEKKEEDSVATKPVGIPVIMANLLVPNQTSGIHFFETLAQQTRRHLDLIDTLATMAHLQEAGIICMQEYWFDVKQEKEFLECLEIKSLRNKKWKIIKTSEEGPAIAYRADLEMESWPKYHNTDPGSLPYLVISALRQEFKIDLENDQIFEPQLLEFEHYAIINIHLPHAEIPLSYKKYITNLLQDLATLLKKTVYLAGDLGVNCVHPYRTKRSDLAVTNIEDSQFRPNLVHGKLEGVGVGFKHLAVKCIFLLIQNEDEGEGGEAIVHTQIEQLDTKILGKDGMVVYQTRNANMLAYQAAEMMRFKPALDISNYYDNRLFPGGTLAEYNNYLTSIGFPENSAHIGMNAKAEIGLVVSITLEMYNAIEKILQDRNAPISLSCIKGNPCIYQVSISIKYTGYLHAVLFKYAPQSLASQQQPRKHSSVANQNPRPNGDKFFIPLLLAELRGVLDANVGSTQPKCGYVYLVGEMRQHFSKYQQLVNENANVFFKAYVNLLLVEYRLQLIKFDVSEDISGESNLGLAVLAFHQFQAIVVSGECENLVSGEIMFLKKFLEKVGESLIATLEKQKRDEVNIYKGMVKKAFDLLSQGSAELKVDDAVNADSVSKHARSVSAAAVTKAGLLGSYVAPPQSATSRLHALYESKHNHWTKITTAEFETAFNLCKKGMYEAKSLDDLKEAVSWWAKLAEKYEQRKPKGVGAGVRSVGRSLSRLLSGKKNEEETPGQKAARGVIKDLMTAIIYENGNLLSLGNNKGEEKLHVVNKSAQKSLREHLELFAVEKGNGNTEQKLRELFQQFKCEEARFQRFANAADKAGIKQRMVDDGGKAGVVAVVLN